MSKDFCANGLRAGVIVSQSNSQVLGACKSAGLFAWTSSLTDLAWTLILEDETYLTHHIEENKKRLGQRYEQLVTFLQEHDLPYVRESNAGFFVWVDFTKFLIKPAENDRVITNGHGIVNDGPSVAHHDPVLEELDDKLFDKLVKGGLYLATSKGFFGEHHGWYRISFSDSEKMLKMGLSRLEKVIRNLEAVGLEGENEVLDLPVDSTIEQEQLDSVISVAT